MFKRDNKNLNNIFLCSTQFFLAAIRAQRDEVDGRILLGVYTAGGTVILRPIRRQCVGVCFSTRLLLTHIYLIIRVVNSDLLKIRLAPELPERSYCVSRRMSLLALALNN